MDRAVEGRVMADVDLLTPIFERKRREIERRRRHALACTADREPLAADATRGADALRALRRQPGQPPRVIAEIKRRSPSAGVIRAHALGDIEHIASAYELGGASAVSVLCDRVGFGGSLLDLRRASRAIDLPLLFKEFVLDEIQVEMAQRVGAHMVLLLVRAMSPERLAALVDVVLAHGMAPVVEAADAREVQLALCTRAEIIGVNARDLKTFRVDPEGAQAALALIPRERIAVHMSGVQSAETFLRVASSRAHAVLIGEGLMRAQDPTLRLRELLAAR
jgi:indole-3-glycerol phosphate synthase